MEILHSSFLAWILVPAIAILICLIAIQDYQEGKIRNRWILLGFGYGLLTYCGVAAYLILAGSSPWRPLGMIFLNAGTSFVIGFFLWKYQVWAAGDAKLFALIAFLLPTKYYGDSPLPVFYSFALLVNILLPVVIVTLAQSMISLTARAFLTDDKHGMPQNPLGLLKSATKKGRMEILWGLFFSLFLIQAFNALAQRTFLGLLLNNNIFIFLLFYIFRKKLMTVFMQKSFHMASFSIGGCIILYIIITPELNIFESLVQPMKHTVIFLIVIQIINSVVNNHLSYREIKESAGKDLQPGMILTQKTKNALASKGFDVKDLNHEGLTSNQCQELKNQLGDSIVYFYRSYPFAGYIALGVLLTILLKGSIIHWTFSSGLFR